VISGLFYAHSAILIIAYIYPPLPTQQPIYDKRMLVLLDQAKASGLVANAKDWCERIGLKEANLSAIKRGDRSFTLEQIIEACKLSSVSIDWICGLKNTQGISEQKATPIEMIEQAVRLLKEKKK